jgi:hypothetical protein
VAYALPRLEPPGQQGSAYAASGLCVLVVNARKLAIGIDPNSTPGAKACSAVAFEWCEDFRARQGLATTASGGWSIAHQQVRRMTGW